MKHSYIDRYIYAVTKRLPVTMRSDVKEELQANIQDMIAEDPQSEALLLDRLHKLGHPRVLANNYRGKDRYVVSPEYYDDYISTLKIVGLIFIIVAFAVVLIQAITTITDPFFPKVFESVFTSLVDIVWESLTMAFAWTTIGFWIASTVNRNGSSDNWKLSDLPDLPESNHLQIGRLGVIVELVVGVSFSFVIIILLNNGIPFLNQSVIEPFIPFFYLSVAFDLLVGMTKLIYGQWRWPVILVVGFEHFYNLLFMFFFLNSNFLKADVFQTISNNSKYTLSEVQNGFATGKTAFLWVIAISSIINLIQASVKLIRARKTT